MSNGMALLRDLQLRRQIMSQKKSIVIPSGTTSSSQISSTKNHEIMEAKEKVPLVVSTLSSSTSPPSVIHITVCTGINCGAGGGGHASSSPDDIRNGGAVIGIAGTSATLIEIEELVAENCHQQNTKQQQQQDKSDYNHHHQFTKYHVTCGGCTNHCTVGPNVFVQHKGRGNTRHFSNVNSVVECAKVMQYATTTNLNSGSTSTDNITIKNSAVTSSSIVQKRRSEGLRWKALRELVRAEVSHTSSCGTTTTKRAHEQYCDTARNLLNMTAQAELEAAGSDPQALERASRRSKRLMERLERVLSAVKATPV